ncbi:hypothetical protein LIPSTDRAFT_103757 [Lipomyces starkeyi NRRL Y-11557]|uniref:Uncharacterized protein n=1 Tax=Lipomyces starkeyi NRRL Y-11557 TaxID=675824 RepID=A0A1E3QBF7_LIPST|nr:hypothetical protein LIPSTDRAFT_103757 [Lipomyces starkeyi NRRL Y-11557]
MHVLVIAGVTSCRMYSCRGRGRNPRRFPVFGSTYVNDDVIERSLVSLTTRPLLRLYDPAVMAGVDLASELIVILAAHHNPIGTKCT